MHARITPFKMKQGSRDEAMRTMERLKTQILGLTGMHHFVCAMDDSGSGYIVSLVESQDATEADRDRIREIWSNFSGLLEGQPVPHVYEVLADWTPQQAQAPAA